MSIAFLVTDQQTPHEGVVRPFVSFAAALKGKYRVSFYALNCSEDFLETLKKRDLEIVGFNNSGSLTQALKNLNPDFVFTDDEMKRLKLLKKLTKKINAKTICYAQVLYGSHAIAGCFDLSPSTLRRKIIYTSMKYLPFTYFSEKYAKLMSIPDLIVANSRITATYLHSIYNVEVDGIVYPAVNSEVFKPCDSKVKKEITLYLGSHLGDVKKAFQEKIIENAIADGYFVNLFGNARIASSINVKEKNSFAYHSHLSDIDLARLYSRSKLTICPQKWELFGLVPIESLYCGTPVLAFNCMGPQETMDAKTGWLANNESEFLRILHRVLEKDDLSFHDLRNNIIERFSAKVSVQALQKLLEEYQQ